MPAQQVFLDLVIIVSAAALVAVVGRRLRLALIPGYLIVGAAVGPHAAGLVGSSETAESVSRLAVILLMFTIGLHMDVDGMRRRLGSVLGVGLLAAIAVTLVGWPIGLLFGLSSPAAVAVSGAISISSTAVVLKTLQERRELRQAHGRLLFGALLVQDLLAVAMLGGVPLLAAWAAEEATPTGFGVGRLAIRMTMGLAGVAAMLVVGRMVLPRLLAAAAGTASGEALVIVSSAVALIAAAMSTILGFSAELGAFLAGFLLASTSFRFHIAGQLMPMRDLFLAVYFTTVGLELDPVLVAHAWKVVVPALLLLILCKGLVNGAAAWAFGASGPVSIITGLSLANAGEFSIVLLSAAGAASVVTPQTEAVVIAVIVCSLILTPILIEHSRSMSARGASIRPAPWIGRAAHDHHADGPDGGPRTSDPAAPLRPHVIIAGFGLVGRTLADRFTSAGIPFTVVEMNPATVRKQAALGRSIVFGDVSNREVLESAGVESALAVLLTIPEDEALYRACPLIRSMAPRALIAVRTTYLSQAMLLRSLGADLVTIEEFATAEAMASQVLERLGGELDTPMDKAVGPA